MPLAIARPRPVPLALMGSVLWMKRSKMWGRMSGAMPQPESAMAMASPSAVTRLVTVMAPLPGENFTPLSRMIRKSWRSRW